ncbi:hypothetical protein LJB76_01395 [Clostridia bacterium OttesenSCG-928-O13]|nr:hypothetical protein [Clostridia bacterium OttesenSCG-928-O13]
MYVNEYSASSAAAMAAQYAQEAARTGSETPFTIPGLEEYLNQLDAQNAAAKAAQAEKTTGCQAGSAVEAAVKSRINHSDEVAYLQSLEETAEVTTAAQIKKEITERLSKIMESSPESFINIDDAVYEKMAKDPAFADKINKMVDKIESHPWFQNEIPGLVSRFVYIGQDGECMVGFLRQVSENEEEENQIEMMLRELLADGEEEMEKILFTIHPTEPEKTTAEMVQEAIDLFLERRKAGAAQPEDGAEETAA